MNKFLASGSQPMKVLYLWTCCPEELKQLGKVQLKVMIKNFHLVEAADPNCEISSLYASMFPLNMMLGFFTVGNCYL